MSAQARFPNETDVLAALVRSNHEAIAARWSVAMHGPRDTTKPLSDDGGGFGSGVARVADRLSQPERQEADGALGCASRLGALLVCASTTVRRSILEEAASRHVRVGLELALLLEDVVDEAILWAAEAEVRSGREGILAVSSEAMQKRPILAREHDGADRSHVARAVPVRDASGAVVQWGGAAIGIEDQLRAEARIRASDERFARIFESNLIGLAFATRDGILLDANDYFLNLIGVEREVLASGTYRWDEATLPKDRETERRAGEQLQESGICEPFEKEFVRKDGTCVPILLGSAAMPGTGAGGQVVTFALDLSDRKRIERGLSLLSRASTFLASSLDLRSLLQGVTDLTVPEFADGCAVHLIDNEGHVELAAFSYDGARTEEVRAELAEHPLASRAIREGVTDFVLDIDSRSSSGAEGESPVAISRSIGATSFVAAPLLVHERTIGALSLMTSNPRRRYDASDVGVAEELARRVAVALDNARLFELAQRERIRVDEANRLKDEFLAMVSHELRSPLNAMLGWATILREGNVDAAQTSRALEIIERNARAQAQLIEDLLDITRITTGKLRLNVGPVDLDAVVGAAVETMQPAARAKGIRIDVELEEPAGPLLGDPERIQQIVWNLVSNAVKFSRNGGLVTVSVAKRDGGVRIAVKDTGQGIAPEFLPHVFERFRQGEGGTTRSKGGLGLGLAIVKHLIELHGGTIEVTSEGEGRGATFLVSLPLHHRSSQGVVATLSQTSVRTRTARRPRTSLELEGLRVLVVDDEVDARELLRAVLEQAGMEVETVGSAEEALRRFVETRPHIVVSDIGMPGEDGYVFMERLRSLPEERGGRTPSIALTAYARMEDRSKALLAGYNMHVAKPIEPSELLTVVSKVVHRASETHA